MPPVVPPFLLDLVPSLYVAFSRILSRQRIETDEMLALLLLGASPTEVDSDKFLFMDELTNALTTGLGYTDGSKAHSLITELVAAKRLRKHLVTPDRDPALLLTPAGKARLAEVNATLRTATTEFFAQQSPGVRASLDCLFKTANEYDSLIPLLISTLMGKPHDAGNNIETTNSLSLHETEVTHT